MGENNSEVNLMIPEVTIKIGGDQMEGQSLKENCNAKTS